MKKSLIGLNAYNSQTKINNANWENSIKEETYLNDGDTISLKASFIDSRNRVTGNINLDQDTTVELSYMFYYINRGGTPTQSLNPTAKFPNRQQTAMEYFNNGTEQPAVGASDAPQPSQPAGTKGVIDVPISDPDGTDKTTANLAPLVESIYHCYSDDSIAKWFNPTDFPLVNFSDIIVGQSYQINSLGNISNDVWVEAGSQNPPVVGDIFKCIASPGNATYPIINVTLGTIGKTYKIITLGTGTDTDWNSINSALDAPVKVGTIFDYDTGYNPPIITDPTQFVVGSGYTVTTAIGYDFSSVGGPALPTNTNTPIDLNTQTQQGVFYQISQLTPNLTDGTSLIDYTPYLATVAPTIGLQFISPVNAQNVANIPIPTDKNGIYAINTGMSIQVTTQGLINWDQLGYASNVPASNDVDIVDAQVNTNYLILNNGGGYGLNGQFPIVDFSDFTSGDVINLPNPYTQPVNNLPVLDVTTLTPYYIGEYFMIVDNNDIDPTLWATMFSSTFGSGGTSDADWYDGMIVQAMVINESPLPGWTAGVKIQWLSFMGIPIGSEITVTPIEPYFEYEFWTTMGYTDNDTFITTAQVPVSHLNDEIFTTSQGQFNGSFVFTKTGSVLRPYTLQVPFTFTTNSTYATDLNSTDTSWVANLIPTDEIVEIENYTFPFSFTVTAVGTVSPIANASFSSYILPTATIQEDYEEGDLYLYDEVKLNTIRANNPVGFSNTIDTNSPDGLPYLLNYCIPKNVDGSTTFDPELLEATSIKPFIKKWKMTLKRGTYTPDYMAEILTRGMSIQRQKIQTTTSGQSRYLGTPIQGINSQMYGTSDFSYIRNQVITATTAEGAINASQVGPYYGFIPPNNEQGAFPSKNQYPPDLNNLIPEDPEPSKIDSKQFDPARQFQPTQIGKNYQPSLVFNPKNKNILPGFDGNQTTLPNSLPVNPRYTALDFNNPDSQIQDDTPFIYRPNAFTQRNSLHPSEAKVRLTYNDYNLSNFNGINAFGDVADENIKNIEMFYKPLCSDMNSSYFVKTQYNNDLPISNDYAIKPVISVPVAQLPITDLNPAVPSGNLNVGVAYSAPIEISTPLVGSPLMSIVYNQENSGLFEFPYMHTPVYAKLTATSDQIEEVVGMYPSTINGSIDNTGDGGILFYYGADSELGPIGLADALPFIENGRIGWVEQLSTITPTSIYGVNIDELVIMFRDLIFIYDETKPRTEYVFQKTSFVLIFEPILEAGFSIPVGQHLVVKGSLLNGVDITNDLVIEVLATDGNGTITEFSYTGTPSDAYYSAVKQSITPLNSIIQIAQQSGIIFYDMTATQSDGTSIPFWENLGFDVKNMTYKGDTPLTYEKFTTLTTRGFLGTSNIFDPDTLAGGTTEQSYVSYTDSLNMLGWYKPTTAGTNFDVNDYPDYVLWIANFFPNLYDVFDALAPDGPPNPFDPNDRPKLELETTPGVQAVGNFELQKKILYSIVEGTVPLSAKNGFSDSTDAGHFLVSIEGYGGTYLLTDKDKLNVKSLVSSYYTGPNAFVSNSLADSALYEHIGSPMKIQNFKVRILNAYTGEEVENLGSNSSIYLEITKNLNKNNLTNITSNN
jgi:hypothetical protein